MSGSNVRSNQWLKFGSIKAISANANIAIKRKIEFLILRLPPVQSQRAFQNEIALI
jgi:hypothetical protein